MATRLLTKFIRNNSQENIIKCFRMHSFKSLGINEALTNRLSELGFERPTVIQEKAITVVSEGMNAIINAETGSGKTLCYLLPILNTLINNPILLTAPPYAVILLPTIELCHQVASVFKSLADPNMDACIVSRESKLLIGSSYPVVMAMPSALLSYDLDILSNTQVVVTDEADLLTTSGGKDVWMLLNFLKHGRKIRKKRARIKSSVEHRYNISNASAGLQTHIPNRQFVFVGATLPSKGKRASLNVLTRWLPDASIVSTALVHQKLSTLDMIYVKVSEETKLPQLLRCLNVLAGCLESIETSWCENKDKNQRLNREQLNGSGSGTDKHLRVLVFANTALQASSAFRYISEQETNQVQSTTVNQDIEGHQLGNGNMVDSGTKDCWRGKCAELHKNVPIEKRLESLRRFKTGQLKVLVCTDIASRGLDIPDISHVIQLDFASNAASVLHRAGRTARAGSQGKVINFLTPKDEDLARALRACDDNSNDTKYEATFSRNRMFRRRIKGNSLPLADEL